MIEVHGYKKDIWIYYNKFIEFSLRISEFEGKMVWMQLEWKILKMKFDTI